MTSIQDKIHIAAKLSKISLSQEELSELNPKAQKIFDSFEKLNSINTEGIEPLYTFLDQMELREDEVQNQITREDLISQAPKTESNHFVVSRVVGEENS